MHWLPTSDDFRSAARSVNEIDDPAEKLAALVALATHNLDYLQTMQVDRLLSGVGAELPAGFRRSKIALLTSGTADHLLPGIRVALLRHRDVAETYLGPYGQFRQEILDPDSGLNRFEPDFVVLAQNASELLAQADASVDLDEATAIADGYVKGIVGLWDAMRRAGQPLIVQQTLLNLDPPLFGSLDRSLPGSPAGLLRLANQRLVQAASDNDVAILDIEGAVERQGRDFWYDTTRWLQAKIEIAPAAAPLYGDLVARIVAAKNGLSRKCLVLDLDNTLWGGVIGDDGVDGIALGEGSALGEAFLAFQRYAKRLNERGIILAVCSKNEADIAESAFREHPEMQLKREDIAAFVANWQDKATNLVQIANELNIGVDALVFADDNPAERARVRQSLPMVAVPEMPEDPAGYVDCLADAGYFEALSFTADDRQRSRQYASNAARNAAQAASESLDDYLASLDMAAEMSSFRDVDLPRIAQLINKTNQFNTTTIRRTLDEVRTLTDDPDNRTLQVRLSDRFGDSGLISAVIMRPDSNGSMDIDSWVMSCRVFGRQLEFEIANHVVAAAADAGAESVTASFLPTEKNGVIADLFERLGFSQLEAEDDAGGSRWKLVISDYSPRETFIATNYETS